MATSHINRPLRRRHSFPAAAGDARRGGWATAGLAAVAAAGAAVELLRPPSLAAPGAGAGVETAVILSGLLSASLFVACFRQGRGWRELLLLGAVTAVWLADAAGTAAPALADHRAPVADVGAVLTLRALAAAAFIAAALAPDRRVARPVHRKRVAARLAAAAGVVVVVTLGLLVGGAITGPWLRPVPAAVEIAAGGVTCLALTIAGVLFGRRALGGTADASLLAGASFLLAAGWLQFAVDPALAPTTVSVGGALRLVAYGLVLAVAFRSYGRARAAAAAAALQRERERIARELHDGLAQDLAAIALHSRLLAPTVGVDHPLTQAASRAIVTSRRTMSRLAKPADDSSP
jgi:signal transduction histidine kinase